MFFDEKQNERLDCQGGPTLDQSTHHNLSAVSFKNLPIENQLVNQTNITGVRFSSQTHVGDCASNKQQIKNDGRPHVD